jgi:hypothetical protein
MMVAAAALIMQQNPSSQHETVFPGGTPESGSDTADEPTQAAILPAPPPQVKTADQSPCDEL